MKEKTGKLSIKEWAEEDRPREKMLQKRRFHIKRCRIDRHTDRIRQQ